MSALAPSDPEAGANIVAAGGASDALDALTELDDYKPRALHVTEFAARRDAPPRAAPGVPAPRRSCRGACAAGHRVRARLHLQVVRGPHDHAHASACASRAACAAAAAG